MRPFIPSLTPVLNIGIFFVFFFGLYLFKLFRITLHKLFRFTLRLRYGVEFIYLNEIYRDVK
jgi:hypothetical protein